MNLTDLLMSFLGLLLGAVIGIGGYAWWLRKQASESLRLPDKWPLASRVLITNEEYEVLKWLRTTFHDHMVMIKLPVLRFTKPTDLDKNGGAGRNFWAVCTAHSPSARPTATLSGAWMCRANAASASRRGM